jgi:hypothetical protein
MPFSSMTMNWASVPQHNTLVGPHHRCEALAALQIVARVVGLVLAALAVQLMIFGLTAISIVPNPGPFIEGHHG